MEFVYRDLRPIPLSEVFGKGIVITMSVGQWDELLAAAYRQGWTLLEVDDHERPVRAYRRLDRSRCSPETQDGEPR
jgi:hypothetical protein